MSKSFGLPPTLTCGTHPADRLSRIAALSSMPSDLQSLSSCADRTCAVAVLTTVLVLLSQGSADAQSAKNACEAAPAPGILWQGPERLGLRDIAGLLAPVLWFSADEPLLDEGHGPIPSAHPC